MKTLPTILLASVLVAACTNVQPVATAPTITGGDVFNFYHPVVGVTGNANVNPTYIFAGSQEEANADYNRYLQKGYRLVGYTAFRNLSGSPISEEQILAKVKSIGADIALIGAWM